MTYVGVAHRLILTAMAVAAATPVRAQSSTPTLTRLQFDIIGVRLVVDPPALTVPKNIATQINTSLSLPPGIGAEAREAILSLTTGAVVEAELRGPSIPPTRITVAPGQPIPVPPLALPGDYFLDGIRLARDGQTILDATTSDGRPATTIPIRVISEVFVTSVTSRPLSLDEIRGKGIVIDQNSFQTVNFQVAFNIDGAKFTIDLPAALPTPQLLQTVPDRTTLIRTLSTVNQTLAATQTKLPPEFDRPGLNFSIAALPFMPVPEDDGGIPSIDIPPVTGLVVVPGNVGFLHQFFSVLLMVTNVAPDGSLLELRDVTGTIVLPKGADRVAGTLEQPGDDPLRLARIEGIGIQPTVPVVQLGPDGKLGTADDRPIITPSTSGEGEFSVEGLQEGAHAFDLTIDAVLHGLPSGPVRLTGQAAGAVFVRNPTFAVTLAHPRTIRSGELYDLYATVMNTSASAANLVSINLDPRGISGAQLLSDQTVAFDTIAPGQAVTGKFRMRAQQTGEVTASSFTGEASTGGAIRLVTGVGERGVPLSANAIVLPRTTDNLPASLVVAAQRVLGQGFSIATAPAQALPEGVLFVKRQTVIDRGIELAEAGERVQFGEPLGRVVEDLLLDWLGNRDLDEGFDQLLRTTEAGAAFLAEITNIVGPLATGAVALDHQRAFAQDMVSRPPHVSAIVGGPAGTPAPSLRVERADGSVVDASDAGGASTIVGAAPLGLDGEGGEGRYAVLGLVELQRHTVEVIAAGAGTYDLGIVIPGARAGELQQLRYPAIALGAGGLARIEIDLSAPTSFALRVDRNGDGVTDASISAQTETIVESAPQLLAVTQLESSFRDSAGDPADPAAYGLLVGALFDKPVTKASAEQKSNYAIEGNAIIGTRLQPSGRLVYLYLQQPIGNLTPRTLRADGVTDARGNVLGNAARAIATVFGDGAHVFGQVRSAEGQPVPDATLRLTVVSGADVSFDVSTIHVDRNGSFDFDFVPRIGQYFTLKAQHPITRDLVSLSARIRGAAEQLLLNPTFLGRGTVRGRLVAPDGITAVPNVPVALIPGAVLGGRGFQVATNVLGEFVFIDVPVGIFTLTSADGRRGFAQAPGLLPASGQIVTQDLLLVDQPEEGGRLVGRVFLGDGTTPADGFIVYVGSFKRDNGTINAVAQATTDATGSFAIAQTLPAGGYDVVAFDPATQQVGASRVAIFARLTASVSIALDATGAVEGVVFDGRAQPVAGAVIAGGVALGLADANGFFRIEGVPAGTRTIEAGDPVTKRRGSTQVTVLPGQTVRASITLESRATIVGRVLNAIGNPVPRASVRIPQVGGFMFVIANNQGVFTFPDLPLGDYLLQAPGPSAESLISSLEANGFDPSSAFTSGDGPSGPAPPPAASDANAVLAAYQKAVQSFLSVDESILGLPMASLGGFGWNKVQLFQDATTGTADVKFFSQGTVAGRTADGQGRPTGALVRVTGLAVSRTGAPALAELGRMNSDASTGQFGFSGIPRFDVATFQTAGVRGGDFTLDAVQQFSPTIVSFRGQLNTSTPDLRDIVLQFPSAVETNGTVSGRVFMPDGATPAPQNTEVRISFGDLAVRTDAEGRFRTLLPIPAGSYTLTARAPSGLRGEAQALVPAGGNVDVAIRLLGLGAVTAQVKRPNGAAVPNASIHLDRGTFPRDRADGTTDTSGVVRFVNLTEGTFSVVAEEQGTGLVGRASGVIVRDGELTIPITITASGRVTGTFLTAADGRPIPFAQIVISATGAQAFTATDAAGRFELLAIPVGPFSVEARDPATGRLGRASGELRFEGQTADVTIVELPRGTISGIVVNADGTTPVEGARVELIGRGPIATSLQATARADGTFRFDGVPAGGFDLKATDPVSGFTGVKRGSVSFEGELVEIHVTLEPFGTVHVTVIDAAGQSATNVNVSIDGPTSHTGAVDATGEITFEFLPFGQYRLVARSLANPGDGGETTATVRTANETVEATARLRGTGSVTVAVFAADGTTRVSSAQVTLTAKAAFGNDLPGPISTTLTGFTGSDGTVAFANVPIGDFFARGEAAALAGVATGSLPTPGQSASIVVQLGASGVVAGRVILPDGTTPAAQAIVTLRFQSQSQLQSGVLQVTAGIPGTFEFGGIPLGTFTVSAFEVVSHGVRNASGSIGANGQRLDLGNLILDNTGPRIVQVSPPDRSAGVGPGVPLVITFDEPIQSNTVDAGSTTSANVLLLEGAARVELNTPTLSNGGRTVTIQPRQGLKSNTRYTLTVKGAPEGPQDAAGLGLPDAFVSTFTVLDVIPPVVVSASPAAETQQVLPEATIRVAFSEAVAGATIALRDASGATVPGQAALTLGNSVAIFSPQDFLRANTLYTFTVSNVVDQAGNSLAGGTFAARFFTVDTIAPLITALQLTGTPRAGSTVSVRPVIAGEDTSRVEYLVGGSQARVASVAPFAVDVALPTNVAAMSISATAIDLVGNRSTALVQSIDIQPNQPPSVTMTNLGGGTSVSQGQILDIQVRATDDDQLVQVLFSAVGAATASTMRQVPSGQGEFVTTFSIPIPQTASSGASLTVQAAAIDAAGNQSPPATLTLPVRDGLKPVVTVLSPVNNAQVLSGQPVDVVVDVTDDVGLASIALVCNPTLAGCETRPIAPPSPTSRQIFALTVPSTLQAPQTVSLSLIATDTSGNITTAGRVLQIVDTIRPVMTALESASGSTRVVAGDTATIRASVNDNVGVTSLAFQTEGAVTTSGTSPVTPPVVSGAATFGIAIPAGAPNGASVTVRVRARDAAGNISDEASLVLTVGDTAPPSLTLLEPEDGASVTPGQSITLRARATDDVAIRRFTLSVTGAMTAADARDVAPATTPAEASFVVNVPATTPAGSITLTVEAIDVSGNSSGPSQRTVTVADVLAPQVRILSPAQDAVVDPRNPIAVVVEAADAVGVTQISFAASGVSLASEARPVSPAAISRSETFTFDVTPLPATGGALTFNAAARDATGNQGAAAAVTVRVVDVVAPAVVSTDPPDGAVSVDPRAAVVLRFSEPMDRASLSASSIQIRRGAAVVPVSLVVSGDDDLVTLTPVTPPLAANTTFTVAVATSALDRAGNAVAAERTFTFTTASADTTPPKVASINPANNAVDVSLTTPIVVTFTEPIDPATITTESLKVRIGSGTVAGALRFLSDNAAVQFTPAEPLPTEAVVITELTAAITDAFGNALVADDGSSLTTPLTFTFLTGRFSLTSPGGAAVIENSTVVLEARASATLGVASVLFTVNGQSLPVVTGPPFTRTIDVGSAASTPTLVIAASARNAGGAEIARDERTVNVVVGLKVTPTLVGIPLGGASAVRFSLSSAVAADLSIALSAGDPTLVSFPVNPAILPAGQTTVDAAVSGLATGATAVIGRSLHGDAAAIVAVSPVQPGQTLTPLAAPLGAAISNPPAAGVVVAQRGSKRTLRVPILSTPAAATASVSVFTTNAAVATATASAVAVGEQTTDVQITAISDGVATIILRAGDEVRGLTVFIGVPPAGSAPLLLANPVGLSISNPPIAGQIITTAGRQIVISVPMLSIPATVNTPVSVSTSNAGVATAANSVVRAGETTAAITIDTVADGVTTLTLRAGGEVRAVMVFVGTPPAGSTPILVAKPVGVSLVALPTLGRAFAPLGVVRTLGLRLFESAVGVDTPVTVATSDSTVASVNAPAVVRAGEQIANLELTTGSGGTATLTIEAAGVRRELTIVVGSAPTPGTTPPIVAAPVGVTVIPNPSIGRVFGQPNTGTITTLGIPLLNTPAASSIQVAVSSSNTAIATVGGGAATSVTIIAGEQVLQLPIALNGAQGASLITIEFDGQRRELLIIVGNPPASEIPAVTAPVVGIRIGG